MPADSLPLLILAAAGAIIFLAGLVHGTLGIGFPMVATPLLALLTDVRSAILITLLPTVAVNLVSIARGGRWGEGIGRHWPLVLMIPVGSVLGTLLLTSIDPAPFRLLLAAIIVLYFHAPQVAERLRGNAARPSPLAYAGFGLVAGLLAGTVNVMVPILIIFTLGMGLAPLAMVQLFNLCFLAGKLAQIGVFSLTGSLDAGSLAGTLPLAAVAIAALLIGMRLRKRIDSQTYRAWLRRMLLVIAALLVGQFAAGI